MVLAFLELAVPARADVRTASYVTSGACQADGLLSARECRNAFANAEAEYYDNVPIFNRKEECEKHFRRCVISFAEPPDPNALRFVPAMKDVQVTVSSDKDRVVLPVLDGGGHPAVSFGHRTILEPQDARSPGKQQNVQARWAALHGPPDASAWALLAMVDALMPGRPESSLSPLAPKLIKWCRRFCMSFSGSELRSTSEPSGTRLFLPVFDNGARLYGTAETRRFNMPLIPVLEELPRFVRR
ncbi:DUF1190 domain-containing protein [Microvirga sp. 0TCS3.31]